MSLFSGGRVMDAVEISAKTVEDAVTQALIKLETTSDKIE